LLRLRRALRLAFFGALTFWATLFAHVWWVFGIKAGYLDGGSYPLTPSVRVTVAGLALDCAFASVLVLLPAGLAGFMLSGRRPRQITLALIWAGVWLFAADGIAEIFAFDFGTTWRSGEAFFELFLHPVLTPLAMAAGLVLLWRLAAQD